MKQKILLIHNFYQQPGGEDTVFQNEAELLKKHGHEVVLYTRSNCEISHKQGLSKLFLPFTSVFSFRTYREVKKIIKEEKIEIVHVHNTLTMVSPSVFYAAFRCKVPVVQTLHNFRMLCPNGLFYREGHICEDCVEQGLSCAIKHRCYRNSLAQSLAGAAIVKIHRMLGTYKKVNFICLTEFNKEKLLLLNKKKNIVDENRIFVKPNFIFRTEFTDTNHTEKKNQYLYAGRLEQPKGIRLLLENWRADFESRLLICGTGEEEEWCRIYIREKRMENVELLGQVPHERLLELMRESKAVVFPSLWYEGLPMTIIESYSMGTKVLGSVHGNVGELIQEYETEGKMLSKYFEEDNYRLLKSIYQKVQGT